MIAILTIVFSASSTLLLWLGFKKLSVIARDTSSREELADTIEKFAALAGDRKGKVVAFRAKPKDDDGE
jgi:hypothetical protein